MSDFLGQNKAVYFVKKVKINYHVLSLYTCTWLQRSESLWQLEGRALQHLSSLFFLPFYKTKGAKDNFGCHFVSSLFRVSIIDL
jgi:hypothetical protein